MAMLNFWACGYAFIYLFIFIHFNFLSVAEGVRRFTLASNLGPPQNAT